MTKKINYKGKSPCRACNGRKNIDINTPHSDMMGHHWISCPVCHGTGYT